MARQNLEQTTRQVTGITLQQMRFVKILEKTAPEVDQEIERQLEENPALEAEAELAHEEVKFSNAALNFPGTYYSAEERPEFAPRDNSETLYDYLRTQLSEKKVGEDIREAADYLIDSLEPDGYLRRSLGEIEEDMLFHHNLRVTPTQLEEALGLIRKMDPAGVGAANLRDCLLLQLDRLPASQAHEDARLIVERKFDALTSRHYHKIISGLRIKEDRLKSALAIIVSLNPRPGLAVGDAAEDATNVIIPDFIISEDGEKGELTITLNNRIPELKIADSFSNAFRELEEHRKRRNKAKGENEYIKRHYNEARDFIKIFRQRQETLFAVMTAIVKLQKEYFETADIYNLRPMMLKDLERETGYDLSTISRATKNKFADLPWGVFPLKFFFSDSKGGDSDSDALTNRKIEAAIKKIVAEEDKRHPLSDAGIQEKMEKQGYHISRRTVAKYRDRCDIPVARMRREN